MAVWRPFQRNCWSVLSAMPSKEYRASAMMRTSQTQMQWQSLQTKERGILALKMEAEHGVSRLCNVVYLVSHTTLLALFNCLFYTLSSLFSFSLLPLYFMNPTLAGL